MLTLAKSDFLVNTSLFQYGVGSVPGINCNRQAESFSADWVFPYFMTALSLSMKFTMMGNKDGVNLLIETANHDLCSNKHRVNKAGS